MGRLIDADRLKEALKEHFDAVYNNEGKLVYSDHICTSDDVEDLINVVDAQPTAYDVDMVSDQLEKYLFEKYCIEGDLKIDEIVKGGEMDEID